MLQKQVYNNARRQEKQKRKLFGWAVGGGVCQCLHLEHPMQKIMGALLHMCLTPFPSLKEKYEGMNGVAPFVVLESPSVFVLISFHLTLVHSSQY